MAIPTLDDSSTHKNRTPSTMDSVSSSASNQPVAYSCGDCGQRNDIRPKEPIRCTECEADGPVRGEVDGTQERMDWPLSVLGRRPSPAHFLRAGILVAKDIRPTTL